LSKKDGRDKVGKRKVLQSPKRNETKKQMGKGSAAISKESWYKEYRRK